MPRPDPLYSWTTLVTNAFPELPPVYSRSLAQWSFGMAQAGTVSVSALALFLAAYLPQAINTVRQRLRELYQPGEQKAGSARTTFEPGQMGFGLIRWITKDWEVKRLALALDPTNLGDRFTVLTLSLVYRGCGIPVAWIVLPGNRPKAWNPLWEKLLARAKAALGDGWTVCVFADRGMESKVLFDAIVGHGWHPMLRVKAGGHFRPQGWHRFYPMSDLVSESRTRFGARGTAYKSNPLACSLLACRMDGCQDPWLILTDLPPAAADPAWYAFRSWIEQGFRIVKRGGWQWHRTRMTHPDRVGRVWAALALATLWMVEIGGLAEHENRPETLPPIRKPRKRSRPSNRPGNPRRHRLFSRGLAVCKACLIKGEAPRGRFVQEDWPARRSFPRVKETDLNPKMTYP